MQRKLNGDVDGVEQLTAKFKVLLVGLLTNVLLSDDRSLIV